MIGEGSVIFADTMTSRPDAPPEGVVMTTINATVSVMSWSVYVCVCVLGVGEEGVRACVRACVRVRVCVTKTPTTLAMMTRRQH